MVYQPGIRKGIPSMKAMYVPFYTVLLCLYLLLSWGCNTILLFSKLLTQRGSLFPPQRLPSPC
jgi:hypothetical protein